MRMGTCRSNLEPHTPQSWASTSVPQAGRSVGSVAKMSMLSPGSNLWGHLGKATQPQIKSVNK